MRRTLRTRSVAASVAVLATIAFAACGDDDDDAGTTDATAATVDETAAPDDTAAASDDTTDATDVTEGSTPSSGSGEVGSREEYVEGAKQGFPVEDAELGTCIAEAIVSDDVYAQIEDLGVPVDQFAEDGPEGSGITLDEEQAAAMAEDVAACGDLAEDVLSEDELACATDNMSDDQFAQYVTFTLFSVTPDEDLQAAYDAMDECLSSATTSTT